MENGRLQTGLGILSRAWIALTGEEYFKDGANCSLAKGNSRSKRRENVDYLPRFVSRLSIHLYGKDGHVREGMTGTAERCTRAFVGDEDQTVGDDFVRDQPRTFWPRHQDALCQFDVGSRSTRSARCPRR